MKEIKEYKFPWKSHGNPMETWENPKIPKIFKDEKGSFNILILETKGIEVCVWDTKD